VVGLVKEYQLVTPVEGRMRRIGRQKFIFTISGIFITTMSSAIDGITAPAFYRKKYFKAGQYKRSLFRQPNRKSGRT